MIRAMIYIVPCGQFSVLIKGLTNHIASQILDFVGLDAVEGLEWRYNAHSDTLTWCSGNFGASASLSSGSARTYIWLLCEHRTILRKVGEGPEGHELDLFGLTQLLLMNDEDEDAIQHILG